MGDALVIAGAPAATGLNGIYYILDPAQAGVSRVWGNAGQMRVCYDNGWTLANSADGKVYFRISEVHIELYTDEKSPETEQIVETVLDAHGIFYNKTEVRTLCPDLFSF